MLYPDGAGAHLCADGEESVQRYRSGGCVLHYRHGARSGFTTTWISNQSRYGVWDTPIGAIGSTCDTQYWVNEYIGTNVVTKDYDEVLIPYLQKVDPNNRRQLIVIHLMGSHVSYWDRYPGSFYHYPVDTSRSAPRRRS